MYRFLLNTTIVPALGYDDAERAAALLRGAKGKRLLYQWPDEAPLKTGEEFSGHGTVNHFAGFEDSSAAGGRRRKATWSLRATHEPQRQC